MAKLVMTIGLILLSPIAHANLTNLCVLLEGVPLPFCKYTRYHECNSGFKERCVYAKVDQMVDTVADPSTGKCADNQLVCTDRCQTGPDGTVCERQCKCRDDVPVITDCRTQCRRCITPGTEIDTGIECPHFCGEPPKCPGTISVGGETYKIKGTNDMYCGADKLCTPPLNDVGGPKSRAECNLDLGQQGGTLAADCCWTGVGNNALGAPPCP